MKKNINLLLLFITLGITAIAFGAEPNSENIGQTTSLAAQTTPKALPDYDYHLTVFYVLCTLMIILIIAIVVLSTTISTFVKSPYFQEKLKKKNERDRGVLTNVILITYNL